MQQNRQTPPAPRNTGAIAVAGLFALSLAAGACRRSQSPVASLSTTPAAPALPPARADAAGYGLTSAERASVEEFLRRNPGLRVASDTDHRGSAEENGIDSLYGIYHPYFVRGDANDDGLLDFLLAFVRRDSDRDAPWFSVVLFCGRPDGAFAPGIFLEREISLADGDVSLDRDSIVVTPDVDEDLSRRYRWDPAKKRHVFVRDDGPEEPASPPPSQI